MGTYKVRTALSLATDPKKPNKTRLVRAGTEVELTDEQAQGLRDAGALIEDESGEDASAQEAESAEVTLPERPNNGASKDNWRTYLEQLNAVTRDELGDLSIPADATRDQMIQIGDERVAEWDALEEEEN